MLCSDEDELKSLSDYLGSRSDADWSSKDAGSPYGPRFGLQTNPLRQVQRMRCYFPASICAGMTIGERLASESSSRRKPGSSVFHQKPIIFIIRCSFRNSSTVTGFE
jgi:hypothetical protein